MGVGQRRTRDRLLAYSSFLLSSSIHGMAVHRPDVVVASSPPLTVGLTGWWLSRAKTRPFVLDVRDLWPESVTDLGAAAPGSMVDRTLGAMAGFLYRKAGRVVVTTDATRGALVARAKTDPARTVAISNGVETGTFAPGEDGKGVRKSLGLGGKFVVSFIGTLGLAQDLDVIVRAAVRLANRSGQIQFLFVGEGPMKRNAIEAVAQHGLPNFTFLPAKLREAIPALIRASDICLVTLRKVPVNEVVIPFRLLEFMSCACPVLLCGAGQSAQVLNAAQAGLAVEPGDDSALAAAIERLLADDGLRRKLGTNGRRYIVQYFSRERTARSYLEVLEKVASTDGG